MDENMLDVAGTLPVTVIAPDGNGEAVLLQVILDVRCQIQRVVKFFFAFKGYLDGMLRGSARDARRGIAHIKGIDPDMELL